MTPDEARAVLGLSPGATAVDATRAHRRLQLRHHPDVVGDADPESTSRSVELNLALAVLRASEGADPDDGSSGEDARPGATGTPATGPAGTDADPEIHLDGDSLLVAAPPDETWIRLVEACATLGGIGHVDPRLGLLEVIVRFEGGPSCSVLLTLQGRAHATEVFCEMESIEAAPTPPIGPFVDALVSALAGHPPPGTDH